MKKGLTMLATISALLLFAGCNNSDNATTEPLNIDGMFVKDVVEYDDLNRNHFFPSNSFNIHGQMETTINGVPTTSFHSPHDIHRAKRVTRAVRNVNGVEEARIVMMKEGVLVYLLPEANTETEQVEAQVYRVVKQMVGNKEIQIITVAS